MAVTSIRDNTVQAGGATNPAGYDSSVASVKMTRLQETAYIERFRDVTDFNVIDQAPVKITAGEESTFKINNIGFLKSSKLEVNGSFTITNSSGSAATLSVANDFPFNVISRVVSQFNGGTTTHSATPYTLFALDMKRNPGKKFVDYERDPASITVSTSIALAAINGYLNKALPSDLVSVKITGTGSSTFSVQSGKYNSLTGITAISMPNSATLKFDFTCTIPVNYTYSDDLLYGLIPLQNNSVFLETKLIGNSVISTNYASCLYASSISGLAVSDYNVNVIPHNEFFSVPSVQDGGTELYDQLIRYNYIITDQNVTVNSSAPDDALSYIIPNNAYLASVLLTVRQSSNKQLQEINGILEKVFIDYNGTAVVRKNTLKYDLMKFATMYNDGLPFGYGQFIKDFANIGGNENSGCWADFLDLYSANSPTLKSGVTLPSSNPVDVLITREMVVPTAVNVI